MKSPSSRSFSQVLMFTFRITAASALIEWPDDRQWPIALGELGVVRPLWDPSLERSWVAWVTWGYDAARSSKQAGDSKS